VPKTIELRAFAKINAGLKVLRPRPDGYHELRTIYQTVALHDRVRISVSRSGDGTSVDCDNPAVPAGPGNLVYRAVATWREARQWHGQIEVGITKRIPLGSGLGGASTDSAATLFGLERLTGKRLNAPVLHKLAASLGSDVPLFLLGGRVLGCGRGEEVYPLSDLPVRHCLILYPGFSVSTPEAYRELDLRLTEQMGAAYTGGFGAWPQFPLWSWGPAENDFELVVFARWPELARSKRRLIRAGAEVASLTGSGSALFALFPTSRQMARASQLIPKRWLVFLSRTLTREEYQRDRVIH